MVKDICSVLVVDDEPLPRKLLADRISKIPGMEVSASLPDGLSAHSYLLEHPVDILITDIRMPGMDGLELAEDVLKYHLGCAVIIISGFSEFEYARRALQYGVQDYLLKPLQFTQVVEVLEKARNSVRNSRRYLQLPKLSRFRELELSICRSFENGDPSNTWSQEVNDLLQRPGKLVRISHEPQLRQPRDTVFAMYRNLLGDLLPQTSIVTVCREANGELYLLVPQCERPARTVQSLRSWFSHVFTHKVTITPVGTVETAVQLASLAMDAKAPDKNDVIAVACDYIQSHLAEPLTREEVASRVFLSPSYFGHLFKKTVGVGYNEYLTETRIRHAKSILSQNMSIREVAAAVGFRDVKYFSEIFCKRTGYMPSEYRRALLTGAIKQDDSL